MDLTNDPVHQNRGTMEHTHAVEVMAPLCEEPMDIYLHASSARNEKAGSVRVPASNWTTWTLLCRAIVADGFVQMVHIPSVVLWVRNALPWDSSRPWKQGPT